jgi:hypothetical protein
MAEASLQGRTCGVSPVREPGKGGKRSADRSYEKKMEGKEAHQKQQ